MPARRPRSGWLRFRQITREQQTHHLTDRLISKKVCGRLADVPLKSDLGAGPTGHVALHEGPSTDCRKWKHPTVCRKAERFGLQPESNAAHTVDPLRPADPVQPPRDKCFSPIDAFQ